MATGLHHAVALKHDESVVAWGAGQPLVLRPLVWLQLSLLAGALVAVRITRVQEPPAWVPLVECAHLPHGIAGDQRLVFVTEPLHGRVAVLDRWSGEEVGELPPPPDRRRV